MAFGLEGLDWSAPWFAPWRGTGQVVLQRLDAGLPLHAALNAQAHTPLRFVPQSDLGAGVAYESYIFNSKQCPVRAGQHDFFNGICWLGMPRAKSRLNALQATEIAAAGIQTTRGPVRDALTLFDENGAVLHAPPALWEALLARDWQRLFIDLRPLWSEACLLLFGHALLEKLVVPYKAITAHVYRGRPVLPAGVPVLEALDHWLAHDLKPATLATKPFVPLPVLGVPGWWPANAEPGFYADPLVFRPARPLAGPENIAVQ